MIANAAQLLSSLSSFVGVVTAPKKASVFHHIEFMRLSERRVLVIMVAPDGDVQNRVIFTAHDYTSAQLLEASNFLTAHYAGLTLEEVRERLKTEVDALRGEITALMHAAVQAGSEAIAESHERVVIAGERNLLAIQDFSSDMASLSKLFDLFEQKTQLMRLLEVSSRADGVRIFIGGESLVVPFEELSVVSAPYEVDGKVVGTLGVIGPTRMAYNRMIQIVDITSRLVIERAQHEVVELPSRGRALPAPRGQGVRRTFARAPSATSTRCISAPPSGAASPAPLRQITLEKTYQRPAGTASKRKRPSASQPTRRTARLKSAAMLAG